jgi:3-hydroxyisobutyrate dehydrogenase/2-hydroxy-3-oxopropionate reductase
VSLNGEEGARMRVAVLGTGRMGGAMAATIAGAGHDVVLWNRDADKAVRIGETIGAAVRATPAEAVAEAEVVVSSLADDGALISVYLGPGGVVEGIGEGAVAVDTSTVDPGSIERVGAAVDDAGGAFLDCPVSGSVSAVEAGSLTIMVGGDPVVAERVRPVLDALAARVIEVGPRGAGAATKLAVNDLVHALNVALSESLVLAERAGVDRSIAYEVFASGAPGAPFLHYKREAYERPDEATVAFSLDLVEKDLELITALGERVGAPLAQATTTLDIVRRANERGFGDRDLSAVAVFLRGDEP